MYFRRSSNIENNTVFTNNEAADSKVAIFTTRRKKSWQNGSTAIFFAIGVLVLITVFQSKPKISHRTTATTAETAIGTARPQHLRFSSNITSVEANPAPALSYPDCTDDKKEQPPLADADTSIILLSSLIPTHPAITMINDTFNSFSMLDGLPSNTPIFISVDGLPDKDLNTENLERLQLYIENLRERFRENPHVAILNNPSHGHISNSIRRALQMVTTRFIYVVQHDFKFIKYINHTSLVKSMREYPGELQIVRFPVRPISDKSRIRSDCKKVVEYNNIRFTAGPWSDNNHLTTKRYYDEVLHMIGPAGRPPEAPMMYNAKESGANCTTFHQYLYNVRLSPFLTHLDGRLTKPLSSEEVSD